MGRKQGEIVPLGKGTMFFYASYPLIITMLFFYNNFSPFINVLNICIERNV